MTLRIWEYRVEGADALSDDALAALGGDGWELVTIHESRAFFKRPGLDYRERITVAQRHQLDERTQDSVDEA